MADDPAATDPLAELEAGPPERAPKKKRAPSRKAATASVTYDRKQCRYPGCGERNSGPRYKNFCRKHFLVMNPEPVEETVAPDPEPPYDSPEPVVAPAPKKEKQMAASKTPTGPDGLPLDKLSALHEPLHVRVARLRGIGAEEPIALPGNGQGWTLTQVRNIESWSRDAHGGGDFSVRIVDERGQTVQWNWHNPGDEKKTTAQAATATMPGAASPPTPAANPVPPAPLTSTSGVPANVVPLGNGLGLTTLSNGMTMVVPMPNATDTAGPPANGPLNARAAAQVWGGNADAAQQFLTLTQRLERAEGEKERMTQQAQHDRDMAEMRAAIAASAKPAPVGPDPTLMATVEELKRSNAEFQRQLAAKDVEARHREEMTELRRAMEKQSEAMQKQGDEFKTLIKDSSTPKEDPFLRALVDAQSKQADAMATAAKAQADAQVAVAQLQASAAAAASKSQNDMYMLLISKNDTATTIAPLMQAFAGVSQLTQGMTSAMLDIVKEVAEIKGEKNGNWAERLFGPLVEKLPEVGQTLAEGYAMQQQAKLRGAPTAVAAQPAQGRKPRVEVTGNETRQNLPREEKPAEATPGNGESAGPVKETPIDLALRGYESAIPGEKEQYDVSQWGPALPELLKLRKFVLDSKIKPADAGQALVQMVVYKSQMDLADQIPAFRFLQGDAEALATFVGMALGACPEKVDAVTFMEFKRHALAVFVKLLEKASQEYQKQQAAEGGEEEDEEDDADDGTEPPMGEAPVNPEIPGATA
jgi:hypothetical protein